MVSDTDYGPKYPDKKSGFYNQLPRLVLIVSVLKNGSVHIDPLDYTDPDIGCNFDDIFY